MDIRHLLCLGLLVALSYVDACGRSGRGGYSTGGRCTSSYCRVEGEIYRENGNVRYYGRGWGDSYGRAGVGVGISYRFKKRSAELPGDIFHLRIETSPCHFIIYDSDRDGVISYDEMHSVFADVDLAKRLFHDLDTTGDEVITLDEFNHAAPKIIYECGMDEPTGENNTDATIKKEGGDTEDVQKNQTQY